MTGDVEAVSWGNWDWRPLVRLVVWALLVAAWASGRHVLSLALLHRIVREIVLGWLLSFGLLTYVQALVATAALRFALALDEAAYALSERIVRSFAGQASFAMNFAAAFGVELALVLGSAQLWSAAHLGGSVAALMGRILR